MKKILIVKQFSSGKTSSFLVPLPFVRLLFSLLPDNALEELKNKGIHLDEIIAATNNQKDYRTKINTVEDGQSVTITIDVTN